MKHGLVGAAILFSTVCHAQVVMTGRLQTPRHPGATELIPLTAVYGFASLEDPFAQPLTFRTWEMQPSGWYRFCGPEGRYTMLFTTPGFCMRPQVLTNIDVRDGEKVDRNIAVYDDYGVYIESAWDDKPASHYFQPFSPTGKSITHVGFRLAHDGVDGGGPGKQNLVVSIHRQTQDTPDQWPQVGPAVPVTDVDSGGAKNYIWAASWNSGEVPVEPGKKYAVHIRAEVENSAVQAFWAKADDKSDECYRIGRDRSAGYSGHRLWMSVGSDGDGLLIPYNKRVQRQFNQLSRFGRKWTQTYVAQGEGLAGVVLYAACSGVQPSQNRQRVVVRIRKGGPDGQPLPVEKIATGNANYTGDASWGVFGLAYAPGEVKLDPGQTYAIEFESIENLETLHGFVNIKNQPSDDKPGFNPYRKHAGETYDKGKAYFNGNEEVDYDLDMQVIEYQVHRSPGLLGTHEKNLLVNGDMETADAAGGPVKGWKTFSIEAATVFRHTVELDKPANHMARVVGGSATGNPADGGYVQRVDGLSRTETYQAQGHVRCSWPLDDKHGCMIGYDPTGQDTDPNAPTIIWKKLPSRLGLFEPWTSEPIRPRTDSISIWLRAKTTLTVDFPFRADFDDFSLKCVRTNVPR